VPLGGWALADRFEVAARLSEGRPAVEHTQTYVRACHVLGYQHPDLTAHGSQVLDRYETESGLDLRVLDDDSAELRGALNTIDEAMWLQRAQLTEIAAAWAGSGADSATRFLQRHCDIAAEVAAHVRAAAEGYVALRDKLWQLVDSKAATATVIDDRRLGERSAWLAAAHTVTAGPGDRSAAEQLVRQQVTPYVDNDIRVDWLTAMRSIAASVEAAYDAAVEALSSAREVCFEIPGELGPSPRPVSDEPSGAGPPAASIPVTAPPAEAAPTVPAAASAPVSAPSPTPSLSPDAVDDLPSVPAELAAPLGEAAGLSSGAGDLGSLGGLAGGIGGVVGQIVNGIGGLLGSLADGLADPSQSGEPLLDDPLDDDDPFGDDAGTADDAHTGDDDDTDNADDADIANAEPASAGEGATTETPVENPPPTSDPVDEPLAQQVTPPEALPPPPAEPRPDGSTPCEIAEDELPQAGQ
jgi:hypothetical protein